MRASTPAFLPPSLRPVAEALMASGTHDRFHLVRNADNFMLLERLDTPRTALWLYGAGHVGQSVVRVLEELPFEITWVDSREELLPRSLPPHIRVLHGPSPAAAAASAPPGVRHLVMTHDHAIDYDICRALLLREDFSWLGLIGSASKSARFRSRLRKDGVTEAAVARLSCPIGVEGIEGKEPLVVAISVAAQLLQTLSAKSEPVVEPLPHEGIDACTSACSECGSARSPHQ